MTTSAKAHTSADAGSIGRLESTVETDDHRAFADAVSAAVASIWDDDALRAVGRDGAEADDELAWSVLTDAGLPAVPVSEARGGFGGGWLDVVSATERLGLALVPTPLAASFAATMILLHRDDNDDTLLGRVADGSARVTVAADWRAADWADKDSVSVVATEADSDGTVTLTGRVDCYLRPSADLLLVPAVTPDGVIVVMVPAADAVVTSRIGLDLLCPLGAVSFDGVDATVVLEGPASRCALSAAHAAATLALSAEQVGVCRRALRQAVEHAKDRTQFGAPIGRFQGVSHRLADVFVETELAATAVRHLGAVLDAGADPDDGEQRAAAQLAHHQATRALRVASAALIQVLGGLGFTWESTAHHAFRKAGAQARLLGPASAPTVHRTDEAMVTPPADPVVDEFRSFIADALAAHRDQWGADDTFAARRAWQRRLFDGGWIGLGWPQTHGGRGLTVRQQVDCERELAAAGAPTMAGILGINNVGPTLIALGTPEQQRHLPAILSADEVWCQGFSEPGAGSDLAGLRCRAVREGDDYVINGQKIWTTDGLDATHMELMVRTDPETTRHAGITMLLVPIDTPGITRRPIVQLDGTTGYAEVFFDDVRVPVSSLLGDEGEGWSVSRTTLAYERTGVVALAARLQQTVRDVLDRIDPALLDDDVARELGETAARARLLDLHGERILSAIESGTPPGPEQSVVKLAWSQVTQSLGELRLASSGIDALEPDAVTETSYLRSRSASIAGGTTEIMKNLIAQKVLGLPR
ncbi:acyl-CoA dehydrogenase [Gordonia sp. KTR9]|uniref:acyl-CoA dehydrogenase n=1 Tax=Gordonia sp. KTR9 TaxID=337191 RepID=UPI00027DDF54|nr:acyl-CoA dehydrogenase [Gordonia sp. KTR9]AFR49500.1 Acyl-CoA dehydrogenase [Gordonia sp. KTR9]